MKNIFCVVDLERRGISEYDQRCTDTEQVKLVFTLAIFLYFLHGGVKGSHFF